MKRGWWSAAALALRELETVGPVLPPVCSWQIDIVYDKEFVPSVEVRGQLERGPDDETDRLTLEMVAELLAGDVAEHALSSDRDHTLIEARFEFSGTVFRLWTIVQTPTLAVVPIGACDE